MPRFLGFAGTGPVNGFRGQPPMDLAPLSSSSIAPSTAERLACRSMKSARSARPPGARVRRTPATATEEPSVIGAQRSHGPARGQTWLPVSEPVILNCVFDFPEEKPETGPSMSSPKSSPYGQLSFFGSVPPLQAYLPPVGPTSGLPGSPYSVRRGARRPSSPVAPVTSVFSCALPVSSVALELSGWWLRQVCDLIGSVQPSIRLDHLI